MLFSRSSVDYCRWLTRSSRSNFALGMRLLPQNRREGIEAVYAFCRAVDDVVDQPRGYKKEAVLKELNLWREELAAAVSGFPTHPIAVALQPVIRNFQIPPEHFEAVIQGVEMDLEKSRYETFEELSVYCRRVASAVGMISVRIFGSNSEEAQAYADQLGLALQMTNILRDIRSDAISGRVYLPQEDLKRFGVTESNLNAEQRSDAFRELIQFECGRARTFFAGAAKALSRIRPVRPLLPAQIMGQIYVRLLDRIEQANQSALAELIPVSKLEQLQIAARLWWSPRAVRWGSQ